MIILDAGIDFGAIMEQGLIIAVVGYVTVFLALVVLYLVFTYIAKAYKLQIRQKLMRRGIRVDECCEEIFISGDVIAAISTALYMTYMLHDEESKVITIKRVSRMYSPWSSKIYGVRNFKK